MANYMAEVAKLLGVELGEKFKISNYDGYYYLDNVGCYHIYSSGKTETNNTMLVTLLNGYHKLTKQPWRPKLHEQYYSIGQGGVLEPGCWMNDFIDIAMYRIGNCYSTAQEAEANSGKWASFYASDEILEV